MHGKIKKVFFRVIHYAIMVMITVLMLMPIGWMLGTSMRQSKESFVLPPSFWPTQFNLDNFKQVFHAIPILKFAWNSLFITFLAAALWCCLPVWQLMLLHELILKEKIFFLYLCWRV